MILRSPLVAKNTRGHRSAQMEQLHETSFCSSIGGVVVTVYLTAWQWQEPS